MKNLKTPFNSIIFIVLITLIGQSCIRKPTSMFSYDPAENPEAGEEIEFINESLDASHFYWDFGNGLTSEEETASTTYQVIGNYTVTLVAENLFQSDSMSETILIYPPTILEIYFYDDNGDPLQLATVQVYKSYSEASSTANILRTGTTNSFGMVKFSNLDAIQYYLWMVKGEYGGAYLSGGNVGPLKQNEINTFYAFAQYYPDGKKKSTSWDTFLLKK